MDKTKNIVSQDSGASPDLLKRESSLIVKTGEIHCHFCNKLGRDMGFYPKDNFGPSYPERINGEIVDVCFSCHNKRKNGKKD